MDFENLGKSIDKVINENPLCTNVIVRLNEKLEELNKKYNTLQKDYDELHQDYQYKYGYIDGMNNILDKLLKEEN